MDGHAAIDTRLDSATGCRRLHDCPDSDRIPTATMSGTRATTVLARRTQTATE
jgi:hypothetical protein